MAAKSQPANSVKSKALLVNVTVRLWTGRKLDRQITDEVNTSHNADADATRVNKLLLEKSAFARVHAATRNLRRAFALRTQPWFDEGPRILPLALNDDFDKEFGTLRTEFNDAADEFDRDYPKYVKDARTKHLKGMFKAEDYPDAQRIRGMFSCHVVKLPFPDVEDFRIALANEQLEDTRRQLEEALNHAMQDPVRRIVEVTGRMTERLKAYSPDEGKGIFRDTLVTNIRDLVDLLPAFNLTNDPKLADLTRRMRTELCVHDAPVLREDELVRKEVAKAADDILKKAQMLMA